MESTNSLSGIPTGKCSNLTWNKTTVGICELYAWCPVEIDQLFVYILLYYYLYKNHSLFTI